MVETQNLSRTAEEIGLSQPAVTKQIQALEDMFGVLLLERSGRRLKTTEAGETLYPVSYTHLVYQRCGMRERKNNVITSI